MSSCNKSNKHYYFALHKDGFKIFQNRSTLKGLLLNKNVPKCVWQVTPKFGAFNEDCKIVKILGSFIIKNLSEK